MEIERYLRLERGVRRRVRLWRQPYKARKGRVWTSTELHDYAMANQLTSAYRVRAHHRSHPEGPNVHDFAKIVGGGSWSAAKVAIFGGLPQSMRPYHDARYIVRCILLYDLWTRSRWCEARKRDPVAIPSINTIRREFGRNAWAKATHCAQAFSSERQLKAWLDEAQKLGRPLTGFEMRQRNIGFEQLANVFGSRDVLLNYLRRVLDKQMVSVHSK